MKKRSILSILLVFVMIAAVCLFVGCDEEETNAKIDNAVVDAVTQATEKIDAAKAALETAIAAKADTATLTTKIEELNAAIAAAKAAATTADAALKTELEAAIAAAKTAATDAAAANLATAKADLEAAIAKKADATTVDTKVTELTAAIEAAKTAASNAATDADTALKTELTAAIEAAKKAATDAATANLATAKAELEAAIAAKADAATLTEKVGELTTAIATATKNAADANVEIQAAIAAIKEAYVAIGAWDEATEAVIDYLTALETTYNAIANDAVKTATATVYSETIIRLYRAVDKTAAKAAYDFATETFKAVAGIGAIVVPEAYYYEAELTAIEALINKAYADVLALDYADASAATVTGIVNKLTADIAAVDMKADKINAALIAIDDKASSVVLSEEWAAVLAAAKVALDAEADLANVAESGIPAVLATYKTLNDRYTALQQAQREATQLNADIETLDGMLKEEIAVITTDYQIRRNAIVAGVEKWEKDYFTDFAKEGENYAMLNHDAYAAVLKLYDNTVGYLVELAQAAADAFNKLGKVTIRSELDIAEAMAAYNTFNRELGSLGFEIEGVPTAEQLTTTIARVNKDFLVICAEAIAAYKSLAVIDTTTVTIYNGEEVNAILAWYNKYFGVDAKVADSKLGLETALTIKDETTGDKLTFTEDNLTAVKALYNAYNTLETAKKAETKTVTDAVAALKVCTNNRTAIDAAKAAYTAWLNGTNAPEGFTADQYKINTEKDTYVVANAGTIATIDEQVAALEARFEAICGQFAALNKTADELAVADVRTEYTTYVTELKETIAQFVVDNDNFAPFTADQMALIDAAEVAIAQGAAIQNVKDTIYAEAMAQIADIEDVRVKNKLTDRANAALADAVATIKATNSKDVNAYVVATDPLALITYTAEQYKGYAAGYVKAGDQLYTAVILLTNRVADGMPANLTTEKSVVLQVFEAAVNDSLIILPDGTVPDFPFDEI